MKPLKREMTMEELALEARWDDIVTALIEKGDLDKIDANHVTSLLLGSEIPYMNVKELPQ